MRIFLVVPLLLVACIRTDQTPESTLTVYSDSDCKLIAIKRTGAAAWVYMAVCDASKTVSITTP